MVDLKELKAGDVIETSSGDFLPVTIITNCEKFKKENPEYPWPLREFIVSFKLNGESSWSSFWEDGRGANFNILGIYRRKSETGENPRPFDDFALSTEKRMAYDLGKKDKEEGYPDSVSPFGYPEEAANSRTIDLAILYLEGYNSKAKRRKRWWE